MQIGIAREVWSNESGFLRLVDPSEKSYRRFIDYCGIGKALGLEVLCHERVVGIQVQVQHRFDYHQWDQAHGERGSFIPYQVPMMRRRLRTYHSYLQDAAIAMERILEYASALSYADFCESSARRDAIFFNFQIIGEAVKHVPRNIQKKYPQLPWNSMAALRNDIAHEYYDPDDEIVWAIIQWDLADNWKDLKMMIKNL